MLIFVVQEGRIWHMWLYCTKLLTNFDQFAQCRKVVYAMYDLTAPHFLPICSVHEGRIYKSPILCMFSLVFKCEKICIRTNLFWHKSLFWIIQNYQNRRYNATALNILLLFCILSVWYKTCGGRTSRKSIKKPCIPIVMLRKLFSSTCCDS